MPDQQTNAKTETAPQDIQDIQDTPEPLPFGLCFDMPAVISHITHLRRTARCLMESLGFPGDMTDDVETLIGELSTNVVRHAHTENGTYQVSLECYEARVVITVIDEGKGFSEEAVPLPGTLRPDTLPDQHETRIGGLGLPLIHAIADHVEIRSTAPHGTTVRCEKNLP